MKIFIGLLLVWSTFQVSRVQADPRSSSPSEFVWDRNLPPTPQEWEYTLKNVKDEDLPQLSDKLTLGTRDYWNYRCEPDRSGRIFPFKKIGVGGVIPKACYPWTETWPYDPEELSNFVIEPTDSNSELIFQKMRELNYGQEVATYFVRGKKQSWMSDFMLGEPTRLFLDLYPDRLAQALAASDTEGKKGVVIFYHTHAAAEFYNANKKKFTLFPLSPPDIETAKQISKTYPKQRFKFVAILGHGYQYSVRLLGGSIQREDPLPGEVAALPDLRGN